jgi:hypothetical protein
MGQWKNKQCVNNLPKKDLAWRKKVVLAFLLKKYPPEVAKQKLEWQFNPQG